MKHEVQKWSIRLVTLASLASAISCSRFEKKKHEDKGDTTAVTQPGLGLDCQDKDCTLLPFVKTVSSSTLFDLYASADHQLGVFGRSMKFFFDARQPAAINLYYINGNLQIDGKVPESSQLHYKFAQKYLQIPEGPLDYDQVTYYTNDKRYFAGTVQLYHLDSTNEDVYGVQFFPQDVVSEATIIQTLKLITSTFHIPGAKMAFVATGLQQTTASIGADIEALGFRSLTIGDILGTKNYIPMNPGEAWGYLRVFPTSQDDLRPTDIPVFDELPLDLTVVAAVVTKAYQDPNSHVNLKSRERGTPNMILRQAAADSAEFAGFADQPVHLTVSEDQFSIEASSDEEVKAKFQERMTRPATAMVWTRDERLLSYDEMCPTSPSDCLTLKKAYGSKASNLGFLAHQYVLGRAAQTGTLSAQLGYDLTPHGFGVPFSYYDAFVNDPANKAVKDSIAALVQAENAGDLAPAERRRLADDVKGAFLKGALSAKLGQALHARLAEVIPTATKIKVRSSANAEDLSGFNGAGLYDSFKARPKVDDATAECTVVNKMNKHGATRAKLPSDSVECAVKAAWASLWNTRAIEERNFARLTQDSAVMGLAIVEAYDLGSEITANSVLVTRVPNTDTLFGYSVSSNEGNNLVTNPAPSTWSELAVAVLLTDANPTSLTITRFAKSFFDKPERTTPVMDRTQSLTMIQIAKTAELAYCRAEPTYYPPASSGESTCDYALWDADKPKALDFEFKLRKDGKFVAKQIREFGGGK